MIEQPLAAGIVGRAIERRTLDVKVRDLRDFTIWPAALSRDALGLLLERKPER